MKILKTHLLIICFFACGSVFSQTTLQQYYIGVGNSSNQLSGSSSFKFDNGTLTMGSTVDNYLLFSNSGAGNGNFGFNANGDFGWWTPSSSGSKKMLLSNSGQLRIGTSAVNVDYGSKYKVQVDGGGYFTNQLSVERTVVNSDLTSLAEFSGTNYYRLYGNITATSYHASQRNYFHTQGGSMVGYQSAAQQNYAHIYNTTYSDGGTGHIWSVQTNTLQLEGTSTLSKFINTYIRTQFPTNTSIGTYYSLYLEEPFGGGNTSQIGNYWGMYQESNTAKNYFAGKVGIGTINMTDNGFKLFVESGIRTRKIKVDQTTWADYVFEPSYNLPSLKDVESYIKLNKHLPGVMSAKEVEEKGLDLGESQATLLKKIEELTLYVIDLQKQVDEQKKLIKELMPVK